MQVSDGDLKISMESLILNGNQISRLRSLQCIVCGIICGILGLTGLHGLMFFIGASFLTDLTVLAKMKFHVKEYTNTSLLQFLIEGLSFTSMSFVLFWTLSFAIVYIY